MTEDQYNVLAKYEEQLTAAVRNNFLRLPSSDFNTIAAVYDQLFTPLRPSQRNCNTCRLNALKTIGRAYLAEKEKKAQEAAEKAKEESKENKVVKTIKKVIKKGKK